VAITTCGDLAVCMYWGHGRWLHTPHRTRLAGCLSELGPHWLPSHSWADRGRVWLVPPAAWRARRFYFVPDGAGGQTVAHAIVKKERRSESPGHAWSR